MSSESENPNVATNGLERLMGERELCRLLGIAACTLSRWRVEGLGPKFIVLGPRRLGYRPSDVQHWLTTRERSSGTVATDKVA